MAHKLLCPLYLKRDRIIPLTAQYLYIMHDQSPSCALSAEFRLVYTMLVCTCIVLLSPGGHLQCKPVGRKPCDAVPSSPISHLSTTDCCVHVVYTQECMLWHCIIM